MQASPPSHTIIDLDGNGTGDLLWRNTNSGAVGVWLMNGDSLTSADSLGRVPLEWQVAGMGDLNDDGKADLVWRDMKTGAVRAWLMNGLGAPTQGPACGSGAGTLGHCGRG